MQLSMEALKLEHCSEYAGCVTQAVGDMECLGQPCYDTGQIMYECLSVTNVILAPCADALVFTVTV